MKTQIASLENLFQPWIGAADDDQTISRYADFDPGDRANVIAAVRSDLLPQFEILDVAQREAIVSALIEAQSLSNSELERLWESMLPPFSLPDSPRDFFACICNVITSGNS